MNIQSSCQDMCANLGFGCVELGDESPPMMALQTPFGFYGGDPFEIYAEYLGDREQIRFFDSGGDAVPLLRPSDQLISSAGLSSRESSDQATRHQRDARGRN